MDVDVVSNIIRGIYNTYGNELFTNNARLKSVLADTLPKYPKEYRLLCIAIDNGVCGKILRERNLSKASFEQLVRDLSDSYSINDEASRQTVSILVYAIHGTQPNITTTVTSGISSPKKKTWLPWLVAFFVVISFFLIVRTLTHEKTADSSISSNVNNISADLSWSEIVDVIAGDGYTIGLRIDGTVAYAGDDFSGAGHRIADWEGINRIEAIGWENYIVGYRNDGTIKIESLHDWDSYPYDTHWLESDFSSWSGIDKVFIGNSFCLGLKADGKITTVSADAETRDAIRPVSMWGDIKQVVTDGYRLVVGLKTDGTIVFTDYGALTEQGYYWGSSWGDQNGWRDIRELVDGGIGLYAIKNDGSVLGMQKPGWTNIDSLYFASDSMFGLRRDGTVATNFSDYSSDDPRLAEISTWENISELGFDITGLARYVPVGLCSDGTIRAVTRGYDGEQYGEWNFTGWSQVSELYSGTDFTIGLCSNGSVLVTGGEFGALDYLDDISRWKDIVAIYASRGETTDHIVGLKRDGTVIAAGDNTRGQCDVYS